MSASLASLAVLLISELHVSLSLIISTLDAVMYTVPPLVDEAVQEVKEGALRERVEGVSVMERNIPPPFTALHEVKVLVLSMLREDLEETLPEIAPPLAVAVQDSNVHEEMVREEEDKEEGVNAIAPPFDDVQLLNVAPEILSVASREANSKTAPSPDSLLIDVKTFVPLSVNFPPFTDINGVLYVE